MESFGGDLEGIAAAVDGVDRYSGITRDEPTEIGEAETPLPVFVHLVGGRLHVGVDEDGERNRWGFRIAWILRDFDDDDLKRLVDLRSR